MTEHDLPNNIHQLIDDVSINGTLVVLRDNQPSIRITPEPEMSLAHEEMLHKEAMGVLGDPNAKWFDSTDDFMTDLESGDAS